MNSGIFQMGAAEYHADPTPEPSLSSSIAHILCTDSPLHAWTHNPRLNPDFQPEESKPMDLGKAVHSILLEGADIVEYLDYPDWRTNKAKDERDAARKAGKVPLLAHQRIDVEAMTQAALRQLVVHKDAKDAFTRGKPEQTIIWKEDDIWCRARPDWLHDSYLKIDDLKTTGITANPESISRSLFSNGLDIQCALYLRGLKAVTGKDAQFRFAFVETTPPYALSVIALHPMALAVAQHKVQFAIDKWRDCLTSGEWPGYPRHICAVEIPAYLEDAWMRKEEHAISDSPR